MVVGVLYKSMKAVDGRLWLLPYVKKINVPLERLPGYIWDSTLHFLVHPARTCTIVRLLGFRNNGQVIVATCRRTVAYGIQG